MRDGEFWHRVLNTVSDGLFMVDAQGRICEVNRALCGLTGYTAEELLGRPCSVFQCDICVEMRTGAVADWCKLFSDGEVTRKRCSIRHKSGVEIPVLKNARLMPEAGGRTDSDRSEAVFSVETVTDIRELVKRDDYIQRVEKLYRPVSGFEGMIGVSAAMQTVFRRIEQAAQSNAPVLLLGESGTGKELAAQALHRLSARRDFPFVEVNCAALNEQVLESELFGHVRGAFTGAFRDREGRFASAHNGTLFLDEVGDIPLTVQVKLLRVLETGVIHRVGSDKGQKVNARIVSATNKDLSGLIEKGLFREDLAFRINVVPVHLPPLRGRTEDISLLVRHCLKIIQTAGSYGALSVDAALEELFAGYRWPGNVRELRNMLEYGAVMSGGGRIGLEHMPEHFRARPPIRDTAPATDFASAAQYARGEEPGGAPRSSSGGKERGRKEEILRALDACGGNVSKAAALLGVHRTTLINRMLRFGMKLSRHVDGA
ncbi:MAG: sigma 54-interacting transcriptional regulator [Desulfovibrio sp.]|jgi:PAS domain S-box-containing protein|nr:sigma 54-interacting transcriptional regulator [Desulfovibrio sp.]